jgi:15-cis-phytoene synthase
MTPRTLDASYRSHAIPTGSVRHLSWLFASAAVRAPLLGIYALQAEWNALMDPRSERSSAQIKLGWWQEEMRRLAAASPVHPISIYLAGLPAAAASRFTPLIEAVDAASLEVSGAPIERAAELPLQAARLRANPLLVASVLSGGDERRVEASVQALGVADYLSRAIEDYRQEARAGRVAFPVDELMSAEIDNAALAAEVPEPRLREYLESLRQKAAGHYEVAARALPPEVRSTQRHLLVLAALGAARLREPARRGPQAKVSASLKALHLAWSTARRAA